MKVYTDGSCLGNGKLNNAGGWGYIILNEEEKEIFSDSNQELNTTNNRMEMMAVIKGIEAALLLEESAISIEVYTDSAYIHNCYAQKWYVGWLNNGWKNSKKKPVVNQDLWEKLIPFFKNEKIIFFKVKGHSGNEWNEKADLLATEAGAKKEDNI